MSTKQRPAGRSPRPVIRGESLPVCIDFLNLTFPSGKPVALIAEVIALLGIESAEDTGRGLHGYSNRVDCGGYGVVCYGGESQRGTVLVSINGAGCNRIARFSSLRAWAEPLGARITRLDIAVDDHKGKQIDVASAQVAWRDGQFKVGGRPPKAALHDDLGSGDGKTLYIGSRESGKLCRIYEKGRQLGEKLSTWARAEVEWHSKDRIIPWDAVTYPARFLAGSFPFFEFLDMLAERMRTVKAVAEITLEQLTKWVRSAAGKTVNCMLQHFGGDVCEVVNLIRREGVPGRLKGVWRHGDGMLVA